VAAHLDQLALAEYRLAVQELVVQNRQQKQVVQAAEGAQRRHYFVQVLLAEFGQVSLKSNRSQLPCLGRKRTNEIGVFIFTADQHL
jgi:hypothetical protein